jgi:hypothetical protein
MPGDENDTHSSVEGDFSHDSHISDEYDDANPWIDVSRKKYSRNKLRFK